MKYRVEIPLPAADIYNIDSIVTAIIAAQNPCLHTDNGGSTGLSVPSGDEISVTGPNCPICRIRHQQAIPEMRKRFAKMIADSRITAWNWTVTDHQRLPSDDKDLALWALTSYLFKDDLEQLCEKDRVRITFFPANTTETPISVVEATPSDPHAPEPRIPDGATSDRSSIQDNPDRTNVPCIDLLRVDIRKIMAKVAWEIECDTGQRPNATKVVTRLKEMADNKEHHALIRSTTQGVEWQTIKGHTKVFTIEACRKALNEWINLFDSKGSK